MRCACGCGCRHSVPVEIRVCRQCQRYHGHLEKVGGGSWWRPDGVRGFNSLKPPTLKRRPPGVAYKSTGGDQAGKAAAATFGITKKV
jgi:hypothetical protein